MTTTHIMSDETGQLILAQLQAISQALDDGALSGTQIDTVLADQTPTGAGFLDGGGLKRFFDGLQAQFAALSHNHSAANITSGTLAVERGGTAQGNINAARAYLGNIPRVTCSTAAATAAKAVTLDGFELFYGARIAIKFSNGNSVEGAITLNVNGTGAEDVYVNGSATSSSNKLTCIVGDILEFYYDNDHWNYIGLADQQKALSSHNHSGDALTPASVAATGAVSGSSISDGTGTLAQLRESVSNIDTYMKTGWYVKRKSGWCFLNLDPNGVSISSSGETFATIPEGYRPSYPVNASMQMGAAFGNLMIMTDGKINIYPPSIPFSGSLRGCVAFPIGN